MTTQSTAIEKSIAILKRLAEIPYEMTALELSIDLDINRSTIHRILSTFMDEMLVLQNPSNKKYTLGPMAYHIGSAYLIRQNSMEQIKHILNCIAKETQQSVGYAVLTGEDVLNIFEIESYQPVRIGYRPGSFYPINCGVYGKCIMAFYEPYERLNEIVYSTPLVKKTPNSIVDPEILLKEYEKIRQLGYAISDEEGMMGAIGVGVPIRNSQGKVVACVGVAAIKSGLTDDEFEFIKTKAIEGANKISRLIP